MRVRRTVKIAGMRAKLDAIEWTLSGAPNRIDIATLSPDRNQPIVAAFREGFGKAKKNPRDFFKVDAAMRRRLVRQLQIRWVRRAARNPQRFYNAAAKREALERVGESWLAAIQRKIAGATPGRWRDLTEPYKRRKRRLHGGVYPIGVATGRWLRSFFVRVP